MTNLEQKLRENLDAAASALVVPERKRAVAPTRPPRKGNGLRFALAGAAAVVALAVPALLWQGGGTSIVDPTTVEPMAEPSATPSSAPSTTVVPETTTLDPSTTMLVPGRQVIDEIMVDGSRLILEAERVDEEDPPTATVRLRLMGEAEAEPVDEIVVGGVGQFFWHTVTESGAVCELTFEPADDGAEVTVQLLFGPSLGCSDPFLFELRSGELSLIGATPEDVASAFVAAWRSGDEEAMSDYAEPDALEQAQQITPPSATSFDRCEGAAGSVYCTWTDGDRDLILRVRTQPPTAVVEVQVEPAG